MLLLFACHAPLPETVTVEPWRDPVLVPGRATGPYDTAVSLPAGLFVGGWPSVLIKDDGSVEAHWFSSSGVAGADGRVIQFDPHGNVAYDVRTRKVGRAPEPVPPDPDVSVLGDALFDLGLDGMRLAAQDRGDDGLLRFAWNPAWKTRDHQWVPTAVRRLVVTFRAEGGMHEVSRWEKPLGWDDDFEALAQADGHTWAVRGAVLGEISGHDGWTPTELPRIATLVRHRGQLWAAGAGVWRLEGGAWKPVLEPWSAGDAPSGAAVHVVTQRWFGEARPMLNGLGLADGSGTCGDPADTDRFATLYGDCSGWIGLTARGAVVAGPPPGRLAPPVGDPIALVAGEGQVLVGGTEGVARREWRAGVPSPDVWAPVPHPDTLGAVGVVAAMVSAVRTDLWFADAESLCHSDGNDTACVALAGVSALAAVPRGVWAVEAGKLVRVYADGAVEDHSKVLGYSTTASLAYDPGRGVLWVATDSALLALDPVTGEQRKSWDWQASFLGGMSVQNGGIQLFEFLGESPFARFD